MYIFVYTYTCVCVYISHCPVCKVEFHSRSRLIKHLLEARVRSKTRLESCRDAFLNANPARVGRDEFARLEAEDVQLTRKARKMGHSHVLADVPAKACAPSILKRKVPAERSQPKGSATKRARTFA